MHLKQKLSKYVKIYLFRFNVLIFRYLDLLVVAENSKYEANTSLVRFCTYRLKNLK